jgi:response regulator NasT
MDSALIVSSGEKSIAFLTEILGQASVAKIVTASTAGEARRYLVNNECDLCIVNAPLPDEFGHNLAMNIASEGMTEVILLVKAELYDEVSDKTEDCGVITVSKPINRALLWNALKLCGAAHKKMQRVQSENKKLIQKIEDIKVIDRAKWILITYLSLSEPEAHKYIEKQAMDMRITRRAVADNIIKTYEY